MPKTTWPAKTELVGLCLEVLPTRDTQVTPQYATGLHAWLLDQVRATDPQLSAYLHDGESEKGFTMSLLSGETGTSGRFIQLRGDRSYHWTITALTKPFATWLAQWIHRLPECIALHDANLRIVSCAVTLPPQTYAGLKQVATDKTINLTFTTPTSFRHKGHHLPLPYPENVFHSYLRRWNHFSSEPIDQDLFLEWIDANVIIRRLHLNSHKVAAGKRGSVTGFTGAVEFALSVPGERHLEYARLFRTLGHLASYCGTGHKTTFGLGQTQLGWKQSTAIATLPAPSEQQAQRIEELTDLLMSQQKRAGGQRATQVCQTRATILARREFGESLQAIARDLDLPYETVKTYVKLARRALREI